MATTLDNRKNFAISALTSGINSAVTTVPVTDGTKFPDPAVQPYNIVIWNFTDYPNPANDPNVEIVRVTAKATNDLTVTRAQESTSAATHNAAGKTYMAGLAVTAKMISDIETSLDTKAATASSLAQFASTTSAQLATVMSDETGSGALVFATSPTLVTPILGTPQSGVATNLTGLPLTTGITGILSAANGGTGVANNAASTITISGNFATTLTVTGTTSVILPTTGTLATLAGSEELTNKTLNASVGKGTWTASGTWTLPAHTLGGTVSGGGNNLNNIIVGATAPLAGTFTLLTASKAGLALDVANTTDGVSNQVAKFSGVNTTRANNDLIYQSFFLANSSGTQKEFVRLNYKAPIVTNASEDGSLIVSLMSAGTLTDTLLLTKTDLKPVSNDLISLGTSALSWSDLFLASGAVINIANGNWVATHTSAIMTVGTGDLRVTTAGTNTASVVTVGGTQTLTAKTLTSPIVSGAGGTTAGQQGYDATAKALLVGDGTNNQSFYTSGWAGWTPTWTNLTVGNATTNTGRYTIHGKLLNFQIQLTWGSTTSASGEIRFSLPVTIASYYGWYYGNAQFYDSSAGKVWTGSIAYISTTVGGFRFIKLAVADIITNNNVDNVTPFTWAVGDQLLAEGSIEIA